MTGTQLNRSIGVLLIIAAVAGGASVILPQIAVGALGGDQGSLEALDVLENIQDNRALYLLGYALDAIANLALVMLAALLYVLFRGRDRALASVMFALLLAAGGVLMIVSILGFSGQALASSVPSEMPPDSRKLLEAFAEWFASLSAFGTACGYTLRALAIIALGTLLVRSSMSGAATVAGSTAPRWLGWLSIVSGIVVLSMAGQRRPARAAHDRRRAYADHGTGARGLAAARRRRAGDLRIGVSGIEADDVRWHAAHRHIWCRMARQLIIPDARSVLAR